MPASPAAVWSPASSSEPESPVSAWTPAAGGSPSAPAAVWEPAAGGSPDSPAAVFSPTAATPTGITLSGTSAGSGNYAPTMPANGYDAWDSGGGQIYHAGGNWVVQAAGYTASKASVAASPVGLTGWTVSLGTGQPVLVASVPSPPAVFVPAAGGSPSAPAAAWEPAAGGTPSSPAGAWSPAAGGSPEKPGRIWGVTLDMIITEGGEILTDEGGDYTAAEGE